MGDICDVQKECENCGNMGHYDISKFDCGKCGAQNSLRRYIPQTPVQQHKELMAQHKPIEGMDPRSKYLVLYDNRYSGLSGHETAAEAVRCLSDYETAGHKNVTIYVRSDYAEKVGASKEVQKSLEKKKKIKELTDSIFELTKQRDQLIEDLK